VDESDVAIGSDLLRAYIAYARENCHPTVDSDEVKERIAGMYADWRDADSGIAGLNLRLVDALNRIAEASARIRLSDTVDMEDVDRAQMVMEQSLRDIEVLDEHGDLNVNIADQMESGSTKKERLAAKDVPGIIETLQPDDSSFVEVDTVVEAAAEAGYDEGQVYSRIEKMADGSQGKQLAVYDKAENKVRML
jgi:replicative DNA helicase Mcm